MDNVLKIIIVLLLLFVLSSVIAISHNNYHDACKNAGYRVYSFDLDACISKEGKIVFGEIDDNFKNSFTWGYQFKFIEDKDE
jgi:hypothetical protein